MYPDALFASYHFPNGPNDLDWQSLHLAFEEKNGRWYLTGLIRDVWGS